MKKTIKLSEAVNEMGNALTAAEWPVKAVKVSDDRVKLYDTKAIYHELAFCMNEIANVESDLKDCVNELCLKCGRYRESHLGACDGCRWLKVKEGFR